MDMKKANNPKGQPERASWTTPTLKVLSISMDTANAPNAKAPDGIQQHSS